RARRCARDRGALLWFARARPLPAGRRRSADRLGQSRVHGVNVMRAKRSGGVPELRYPPDLPITRHREDIVAALRAHPVIVVCGDTGSGKTTQLPKLCLEAGRGLDGMIGITQP